MDFAVESKLDALRDYPSKKTVRMPNSFIFIAESPFPNINYIVFQGYEITYDGYEGTVKQLEERGLVGKIIRVWRKVNYEKIPIVYSRLRVILDSYNSRLDGEISTYLREIDKLV